MLTSDRGQCFAFVVEDIVLFREFSPPPEQLFPLKCLGLPGADMSGFLISISPSPAPQVVREVKTCAVD